MFSGLYKVTRLLYLFMYLLSFQNSTKMGVMPYSVHLPQCKELDNKAFILPVFCVLVKAYPTGGLIVLAIRRSGHVLTWHSRFDERPFVHHGSTIWPSTYRYQKKP